MAIEIFVTERHAVDALREQRVNAVLDARRITVVGETTRKPCRLYVLE